MAAGAGQCVLRVESRVSNRGEASIAVAIERASLEASFVILKGASVKARTCDAVRGLEWISIAPVGAGSPIEQQLRLTITCSAYIYPQRSLTVLVYVLLADRA